MKPSRGDIAGLEAWEERRLTPEEFAARVAAPWTQHEAEDFAQLVAWFNRRYPTVRERLASTRHLMAQWDRSGAR